MVESQPSKLAAWVRFPSPAPFVCLRVFIFQMTPVNFLAEYFNVLVFGVVAFGLSVIILSIPLLLAKRNPYKSKNMPYECGFAPFELPRKKTDVKFYLVAILFIIFDLEIAFLFPWAVCLKHIGIFGFIGGMVFLTVLTVGLMYEWRKGAMDW